jgi:hypothetical protein
MRVLLISEITSTKIWWILALVSAVFTLLLGIVPSILLAGVEGAPAISNPSAMAQMWTSLG